MLQRAWMLHLVKTCFTITEMCNIFLSLEVKKRKKTNIEIYIFSLLEIEEWSEHSYFPHLLIAFAKVMHSNGYYVTL